MARFSRHQERIWALQILYSLDIIRELNQEYARKHINGLKEKERLDEDDYYFVKIIKGVIEKIEYYDQVINEQAINWEVKRMAYIDRNILRIALFEMEQDLPVGVVINEAVELAKEYGDKKSAAFINGILAKIEKIFTS